ncbi:RNA polymerase subunit sigma-70 [Amycolatopsis roodepoortensis]|uniref:RNA polymerase subunit sigma-70 n=1 Tax=Amycolatopsis roodepoortensis TaxID=700274 RepID=UPI00214C1858|nr:RNA polymerase subunit sigma-70 [Amycolatopsis roodepoortensis]UUV32989.1 RNA polymerase subunit sigma-70 [Amycolatopsis roodepoortensis]
MTGDLITRARNGDGEAFRELTDPYRRELHVHCYRILGSMQDAEDALQETLVSAWQGLDGFRERSSVRTWLYRIATNRCLKAVRSAGRRPRTGGPVPGFDPPEPTRLGKAEWLEPYPDILLAERMDTAPGPGQRYEAKESISLAFVTAVQLLPPRQRAVLILRDVLEFPTREVAHIMDTTEQSVAGALKRARTTLRQRPSAAPEPPPANSATERELVIRFTRAFEVGDVDGLVALLTDDVWLTMPPLPLEYQGRDLAARFHTAVTFRRGRTYRLMATRANGQPAFGMYIPDPQAGVCHANGLMVLTLAGSRIRVMTRFEKEVLRSFRLPLTLPHPAEAGRPAEV